jgi:hypothetical protein
MSYRGWIKRGKDGEQWGNIYKKKVWVGGVETCTTKHLSEVKEDSGNVIRWPTLVAMLLGDYDDHHDCVFRIYVF